MHNFSSFWGKYPTLRGGWLHVWKRNTLLSIAGGTVLYMVLVQLVF